MIETFWQDFCQLHNLDIPQPQAWMFGDGSKEMGDELGYLVSKGQKRATCSALETYRISGDSVPEVGQYDIILNGDEDPLAITQVKKVELVKMKDVSPEFAKKEGEGDLSYEYWYDVHIDFFTNEFKSRGLTFSTEEFLVCEEFDVLYTGK